MRTEKIPSATLKRYPIYLKALRKIQNSGQNRIMSRELADYVHIKPTTIRRDFSLIDTLGKQGYGYDVAYLIETFSKTLGIHYDEKIILVGAGNLGKAILNYNHWENVVGEIICAFDKKPEKCKDVSVPVYHIDDLQKHLPQGCHIAIVCISGDIQHTVNLLVEAGITGIVDFTHEHFTAPKGVKVRSIDVVSSIQEIVFETNNME